MEKFTIENVRQEIALSLEVKQAMLNSETILASILSAGQLLQQKLTAGGTVYACGNGGSACDAMHLTEELVARYKRARPGLRAMHFLDAAAMSCWANDYDFSTGYSRQVETFCGEKDVLVAISTSGKSPNIVKACEAAKTRGCKVIGLTGAMGEQLEALSDICIKVPYSAASDRIQEAHIMVIHIWCELLDLAFLK